MSFAYSGEFPIFQDPEVDLLPLEVLDLTVGGADVVFRPRFKNLNGYDLILDTVDFELFFSGHPVLAGAIEGDKSLPRTGEKIFALPFLVDFFEAGEDVRAGFAKDEFPCRFTGRIVIASVWGPLVIRFDRTQPLRLEKEPKKRGHGPEVRVPSIEIRRSEPVAEAERSGPARRPRSHRSPRTDR